VFTQCSKCETVFRLSAEALRAAGGQVRCGRCGDVFNALARLAEDATSFTQGESSLELETRADEILQFLEPVAPADMAPSQRVEIAQLEVLGPVDDELTMEASLEFTLPPGELDRIFIGLCRQARCSGSLRTAIAVSGRPPRRERLCHGNRALARRTYFICRTRFIDLAHISRAHTAGALPRRAASDRVGLGCSRADGTCTGRAETGSADKSRLARAAPTTATAAADMAASSVPAPGLEVPEDVRRGDVVELQACGVAGNQCAAAAVAVRRVGICSRSAVHSASSPGDTFQQRMAGDPCAFFGRRLDDTGGQPFGVSIASMGSDRRSGSQGNVASPRQHHERCSATATVSPSCE